MDDEKKEELNTESLSVVPIIGLFLLLAISFVLMAPNIKFSYR